MASDRYLISLTWVNNDSIGSVGHVCDWYGYLYGG